MRVLIVDDSVVFRSQIRAAIENVAGIEVAGTAANGKLALARLAQGSIDAVTLDMEMPEMGGLETIKEIRKAKFPVRILIFSSHTTRGSEMALEALAAGADDFVAKPAGSDLSFETAGAKIKSELLPKLMQFFPQEEARAKKVATSPIVGSVTKATWPKRDLETFLPLAIVIGSSTGGPPALEKVLKELKGPLRIPILIAQHMPPVFTASLAKRLTTVTGIECAEAKHGEPLLPNRIYVAPGDFHMSIQKNGNAVVVLLDQGPFRNSVRPAADNLFESVIKVFGGRTMAFVLTGMGEDGMVGARAIKDAGGGVAIQSRESCVVFGMPGAISALGCHDGEFSPDDLNRLIRRMTA